MNKELCIKVGKLNKETFVRFIIVTIPEVKLLLNYSRHCHYGVKVNSADAFNAYFFSFYLLYGTVVYFVLIRLC